MPNVPAKGPAPGKSGIQTFLFSREESEDNVAGGKGWTVEAVRSWLTEQKRRTDGIDVEEKTIRARQFNPDICDPKSYQTLTDGFPKGVKAVSCTARERSSASEQARSALDPREVRRFLGARSGAPEFREFLIDRSELRLEGDGGARRIVGHGAVFREPTLLFRGFKEVVLPGAFRKTIQESDVPALFNHNPDFLLGRNSSGTLKLEEDDVGLRYTITPPDTQTIRDLVLEPLRRRDLRGSSFGFVPIVAPERQLSDGTILRELAEVRLVDIGPVTRPQYAGADAALRAWNALGGEGRLSSAALTAFLQFHREEGTPDEEVREILAQTIETLWPDRRSRRDYDPDALDLALAQAQRARR